MLGFILRRKFRSSSRGAAHSSRPIEWMDHEECAAYLRTTPDALYKLPVPHHKLGGKRLYSLAKVDGAVRGL